MYESLKPNPPLNSTDPIVRHDGGYDRKTIVKIYEPEIDEPDFDGSHGAAQNDIKVEGILTPIIKVNNRVIDMSMITYFDLKYTGFVPEIEIAIDDSNNDMIKFADVPGLDNIITVVIIPPIEGVYKKISLNFYITDCDFIDGLAKYKGTLKFLPFEATQLKQMKFHHPQNGCNAKYCQLPPNAHPTTFEFLHVIAEECGLGFAATDKTKEIKDDRYRLLSSEKFKDVIPKHIAMGGLDEHSFFDAWLDLYGYIVMVNVAWLMETEVYPDWLGITALFGVQGSDTNVPEMQSIYVHRTITNYNDFKVPNNLQFEEYTPISDPGTNFKNGTFNHYGMMGVSGSGNGDNAMSSYDIQQQENSATGQKNQNDYMFETTSFSGFEMADMNPILKQSLLREKFFEKIRSRMIVIKMTTPNLGLERGTLLNVNIYEYNPIKKQKIIADFPALAQDNSATIEEEAKPLLKEVTFDINQGIMNPAMSGMYYIDGMEFKYDNYSQQLEQYLFLIKKGQLIDWDSRATNHRIDDTATNKGGK